MQRLTKEKVTLFLQSSLSMGQPQLLPQLWQSPCMGLSGLFAAGAALGGERKYPCRIVGSPAEPK